MIKCYSLAFLNFIKKLDTMSVHNNVKKVTTHVLQEMKNAGEKITMLTGYDYTMARIIDRAGIDVILVGD